MALDAICDLSPWSEENMRAAAFERHGIFLGIFRGYASGTRLAGFALAASLFDQGEIYKLAVHPDFRRRGIGSALLAACCAELRSREVDTVYLEVREGNSGARAMYEQFGFTVQMVRRGYYRPDGEDAVVYRVWLASTDQGRGDAG